MRGSDPIPDVADVVDDQNVEDAWMACEKAAHVAAQKGQYDRADNLTFAAQYIRWSWEKLTEAGIA